jgi:hypothetical protein
MAEQEHELQFTVYITTYGRKVKMVKDSGRFLAATLHQAFGDNVRIVDHRLRPVKFDPNAHDYGTGET